MRALLATLLLCLPTAAAGAAARATTTATHGMPLPAGETTPVSSVEYRIVADGVEMGV